MLTPIKNTLLVSNDPKLLEDVSRFFTPSEHLTFIDFHNGAEYIAVHVPDLIILDFTDWEEGFNFIDEILEDPWLHHQSIITLNRNIEYTHSMKSSTKVNILSTIPRITLNQELSSLLTILRENSALLYNRVPYSNLSQELSGTLILNNSLCEIEIAVNLIGAFLYNTGRIDIHGRNSLSMGLTELLVNALEHGNLGITFEAKRDHLERGGRMSELIEQQLQDSYKARRKIRIKYHINSNQSVFTIADEGQGFPSQTYLEAEANFDNFLGVSGRGIIMAQTAFTSLVYSNKGSVVTTTVTHQEPESNAIPLLFHDGKVITLKAGETLIKNLNNNENIYFISKGQFGLYQKREEIMHFSADDLFIGHSPFHTTQLLPQSVKAVVPSTVVMLTKKQFSIVIRKLPHYALFLARFINHSSFYKAVYANNKEK